MTPSPKVLIVDADPAYRRQLARLSEEEGFAVVRCSNGQRAIEVLWENTDVSAVIINSTLPEISAAELLRQVQANPSLKKLPVITFRIGFSPDASQCLVSAGSSNERADSLRDVLSQLAKSHRATEWNKGSGTIFLGCAPA